MIDKILEYIKKNRVSTTELADCMGKQGLIENAIPLNKKHFIAGKVHYSYCDDESNWNVHKTIQNAPENSVVFVDDLGSNNRAIFGDLVAKYLFLYQQVVGIVTNGKIRDAHTLTKENYPIWSNGANPVGCFNVEPANPVENEILISRMNFFENSLIVADDTGVVVITSEFMTEEFYKKLEWIEEQEDIWFDCIDRKKWNTFETVCLKKYEENK
jgi:regulator of RNase E activity RraA